MAITNTIGEAPFYVNCSYKVLAVMHPDLRNVETIRKAISDFENGRAAYCGLSWYSSLPFGQEKFCFLGYLAHLAGIEKQTLEKALTSSVLSRNTRPLVAEIVNKIEEFYNMPPTVQYQLEFLNITSHYKNGFIRPHVWMKRYLEELSL